ncbi:hypothetical protein FRC12_014272 [Ceratobasidium sp. 428]|nr:hypothetical protein FRC12_014272 [Ceratobasidium sp. 428]
MSEHLEPLRRTPMQRVSRLRRRFWRCVRGSSAGREKGSAQVLPVLCERARSEPIDIQAARELYTWSKCRHPNVVELLGLAEFRGQIAMVSPWMAGGGIDQLNRSNRAIDRCRLCFQIAEGLAYLHEIGIVHGDLKGGNVLLSDNDDAQIADFGNAVLASNTLAFTRSTTRFAVSLRWAAPELLQAKTSYSRQADVYSLGMTILEVISRQLPYADISSELGVMTAILQQQYPKRPEDTIPRYSEQGDTLWSLLTGCWSWDPNDRPEAASIVKIIETIKPEDLLVRLPETSTGSPLPRLALTPNVPKTKRRPETLEGEGELRNKRPRLEMDKPAQIPIAHQYLISKARDMLNEVACWEGQDVDDFLVNLFVPKLKYGPDDLTDLLSEIRKLGIDVSETTELELLSKRVYNFQLKAHRLLLELRTDRHSGDAASLDRLEFAIRQGLWFQQGELPELERIVASLEFSRDFRATNVDDLTLDQVEQLITRGQGMGVSLDHYVMAELALKETSGRQWIVSAMSILAQSQPEMKDLDQLVTSAHSIPTLPDMLGKLTRLWRRGRQYEQEVEVCLRPPEGTRVGIDEAIKVATTALEEFSFLGAEELLRCSREARTWEKRCEEIMTNRFEARGNATVFDEFRAMRDGGRGKFWAFEMPWSERMAKQLAKHEDWISRLPRMRPGLPVLDLDSIVRDMTGNADAERAPPKNDTRTCICFEPVVVGESAQDPDQMAQCDHCLVRFHAKCIEGSCPFCDDQIWSRLMGEPRTLMLQYLNSQHLTACELTQYYSPEYRALRVIRSHSGDLALSKPIIRFIKQLGRQESPDPAMIPQLRHLMRRLYRIQFVISARPGVFDDGLSLPYLHRQMTMQPQVKQMARRKPRFVFGNEMNYNRSRCLCGVGWDPFNDDLTCSKCLSWYHEKCVAVSSTHQLLKFVCPLCLLKEGKSYEPAEVRVRYHDDDPEENAKFVDVKACLDNYSWTVIRRALPPPVRPTITVELLLFIPGTNPNVEEPKPHPKSYSKSPIESTLPQYANEGSHSDEGFSSGSESN